MSGEKKNNSLQKEQPASYPILTPIEDIAKSDLASDKYLFQKSPTLCLSQSFRPSHLKGQNLLLENKIS